MSKLACIKGDNKGDEFVLEEGVNVIGRTSDCRVTLFDKKCSRAHCHLHKRGKYYSVEDLDSTNGTYLNGKALTPSKNVSLAMGDCIQIGKTVLQLSDKPMGNLVTQAAVDVAADMQSTQFDKLLSSAAKDLSKHPDSKDKRSFVQRFRDFFSSRSP